ncbi:MAG TPA: hypothetical protein VL334_17440 [Anaerolineae bacterium]|nr:hypothetical protein [Anaerolineae bacterium]
MTTITSWHATDQRLILYVLGQSDTELAAHLETCEACRARTESYSAVLTATRDTLQVGSSKVNLVSCANEWLLESAECRIGDSPHTLLVALSTADSVLHGHLTVDETCTCWEDAPVRLFGPRGLVASGRVDGNGDFQLPKPSVGENYSLGLVLTRHNLPELQIIGSFLIS